nr:hypothetical protein [Pseudoclavibacter sp. Marseille-Q3772]
MSPHPTPLPQTLAVHGFTCAQAFAAGVTRNRLRASDLCAPYWGVRAAANTSDPLAHIRAAAPFLSSHQALASISAAQLLGLPLPSRLRDYPELIVASPVSAARSKRHGVRPMRMRNDRFAAVRFEGIPILSPRALAASLSRDLDSTELTVVLDALCSEAQNYPGRRYRAQALLSSEEIRKIPQQFARMHGIGTLREACEQAESGVESPMETVLRVQLIAAGFPKPEINATIRLSNGRTIRPDLLYRDARVLIEYLGDHHRTDRSTWEHDVERSRDLAAAGYIELQVTASDLQQPRFGRLVARLRQLL